MKYSRIKLIAVFISLIGLFYCDPIRTNLSDSKDTTYVEPTKSRCNVKSGAICQAGSGSLDAPIVIPSFSGGVHGDDFCLKLSINKKGAIYFITLNGTDTGETPGPHNSATQVYSSCIAITDHVAPVTYVKAFASDLLGNSSEISTWNYTINKSLPKITGPSPSRLAVSGVTTPTQFIDLTFHVDVDFYYNIRLGGTGLISSGKALIPSVHSTAKTTADTRTLAGKVVTDGISGADLEVGDNVVFVYGINALTQNYSYKTINLFRDDDAPVPTVDVAAGHYGVKQSVTISVNSANEPYGLQKVVYTTNGDDPAVKNVADIETCTAPDYLPSSPTKACEVTLSKVFAAPPIGIKPHFLKSDNTTACASPTDVLCDPHIKLRYFVVDTAGNQSSTHSVDYYIHTIARSLTFATTNSQNAGSRSNPITPKVYECKGTNTFQFDISSSVANAQYQVAIGGAANTWNSGTILETGVLTYDSNPSKNTKKAIEIGCSQLTANANNDVHIRSMQTENLIDNNYKVWSETHTIYRDDTKPNLTTDKLTGQYYPTSGSSTTHDVTISISGRDVYATVYYTTDGTKPSATNGTAILDSQTASIAFLANRTTITFRAVAYDFLGNESDEFYANYDLIGYNEFGAGSAYALSYNAAGAPVTRPKFYHGPSPITFRVPSEKKIFEFANYNAVAAASADLDYLAVLSDDDNCNTINPRTDGTRMASGSILKGAKITLEISEDLVSSIYVSTKNPSLCLYTKLPHDTTFDNSDPYLRLVLLPDTTMPTVTFNAEANNNNRFLAQHGYESTEISFTSSEAGYYLVYKMVCGSTAFGDTLSTGSIYADNDTINISVHYSALTSSSTTPECFGIQVLDRMGNTTNCATGGSAVFCGTDGSGGSSDSGFIWRNDTQPVLNATGYTCSTGVTEVCDITFSQNVTSEAVVCISSETAVCPTNTTHLSADHGADKVGYIPMIRNEGHSYNGIGNVNVTSGDTAIALSTSTVGNWFLPRVSVTNNNACTGNNPVSDCGYNLNHNCSLLSPQTSATSGPSTCWGIWGSNLQTTTYSHDHDFNPFSQTTDTRTYNDNVYKARFYLANVSWRNIFSDVNTMLNTVAQSNITKSNIKNSIDWSKATYNTYAFEGSRVFSFGNKYGLKTSSLVFCHAQQGCTFNSYTDN